VYVDNDSANVTSAGKSFQICGSTTGKAWVTVDSLTGGLPDGNCRQSEAIDGQADQQCGSVVQGIVAQEHTRLCMPGQGSRTKTVSHQRQNTTEIYI